MWKKTSKKSKEVGEEEIKTAKTETTTTTVQTGTYFDESSRRIVHQTTRQTIVHQQQSRVSERVTQQSISSQELEELLPQFRQQFGISSLNERTPSITFPILLQKEETATQKSGSKVTSNVEEQRIKFNSSAGSSLFNTPKTKNDSQLKKSGTQSNAKLYSPSVNQANCSQSNLPNVKKNSFGAIPKSQPTQNESSIRAHQKSKLKPGIAYIFNNQYFDDPKTESRDGSDADVKALIETFKVLQLTVEIYEDPNLNKIKSVVKSICSKDFSKHSCLVIAILSHGNRFETIQAKDKSYSIDDDVLFPITDNPTLCNKPKIFFIQACKGSREVASFPKDASLIGGVPAEILKCYSTFEGYVSYRTTQGTFFIQKLCENLKKDGKTKSIQRIMMDVTATVKTHTQGKQIPSMTVNLTENFVFGDYMN